MLKDVQKLPNDDVVSKKFLPYDPDVGVWNFVTIFDDVDNIPGLADPKPDSASAAHDNGKLKYWLPWPQKYT